MSRTILTVLATVALATGTAAAQTVSVTACGQTVPARLTGVVEADLFCGSAAGAFAVAVEKGGTLDLAGHTLAGGGTGVRCTSRCTVTSTGGPGTIRDAQSAGIAVVDGRGRGRLTLSNVILENNVWGGWTDFMHGKVTATQVTLTGSGLGFQARKVLATGLVATGNYVVMQVRKTVLRDSSITGTTDTAITGRVAVLTNSTVTGSGSGIDLLTLRRPRLFASTCGVSRDMSNPDETWGVCAND